MVIEVRDFVDGDEDAVEAVNRAAFETGLEAALVRQLRAAANPRVELVAVDADEIVGHILFSPVTLSADRHFPAMGLAPMSVLPAHQRHGIGSALLRAGLECCRQLGQRAVFVLGHPEYYPRFGFVPASAYGISSTYEVPDPVFMALELEPGALSDKAGQMRYHPAFDELA
jgi:putative acetyltransferase